MATNERLQKHLELTRGLMAAYKKVADSEKQMLILLLIDTKYVASGNKLSDEEWEEYGKPPEKKEISRLIKKYDFSEMGG